MKNFLTIMCLSVLMVLSSCKKEDRNEETVVADINDMKVPIGFTWENSKDINFEISITDVRFKEALHVVSIYDADPSLNGKLLAKGSGSIVSSFMAKVYIPNTTKEVFVVKTAPDNSTTTQKVAISGEKISVQLSATVKGSTAFSAEGKVSGLADSPTCTTGCTTVISSSNTNLNINTGQTVCITGNNITVGMNVSGGTVRICGTNVTVQNASFNNSSTLVVTNGASVTFSNLNMGSQTTFNNYGNSTVNGSFSPQGTFLNENTLATTGDFNLNSGAAFTNNGIITTAQSMNFNTNVVATNNGSITVNNNFQLNSQSVFVNNCFLWIKNNYNQNASMRNYNLVKVNNTATVNGSSEFGMYNGAMLKTNNMTINGRVKGYGTTSLVKVAATTIINGGSVVDAIRYCDANGIETNNGTFSGGASLACNLYIPVTNCNTEGNGTAPITDTDGDGVNDPQDEYPNDATKAYNNYYPSSSPTSGATLAFEDRWPLKGDYDLNDVVVSYRYKIVTNATNKVVQVVGDYNLQATGGEYQNGFAVEFPIGRASISGVTGGTLETGQTNAVLVLFTNMRQEMVQWNTRAADPVSADKSYTVSFNVSNGPALSTFGLGAYNPFIWNSAAGRGYEIHLPGKTPTTLANTTLFGTGDDNSSSSAARYYVTSTNLPWAINIPATPFIYPLEQTVITSGYLRFQSWAESGGSQYADWYSNTSPGYRNTGNLFPN